MIKIEGCYHGHHDSAMVSVGNERDEIGPVESDPSSPPAGFRSPCRPSRTSPESRTSTTSRAAERILLENPGQVAGAILEPIMMNAGIIEPDGGYLAGTQGPAPSATGPFSLSTRSRRDFTTGPGGATRLLGVTPDLVCLAKAMGGGIPCGAIGGTHEVMELIVEGEYEQVGTFNGNPLTMAAVKVVLTEILNDDAYSHIDNLRQIMVAGVEEAVAEHDLEAYPIAFGAKGCVTFAPERTRDFRDFLETDDDYSHLHWLFQHNGGVFMPPWGKSEQWTMSVQHTEEDAQQFVDNFRAFARVVAD